MLEKFNLNLVKTSFQVRGGAAQQLGEVSLVCGHPGHQLARAAEEEAGPGEEDSVIKV